MKKTLINLIGRQQARKLANTQWLCELRILNAIQSKHPHWYQRLFSGQFITWLKIRKTPHYFNQVTHTTFYKPIYPASLRSNRLQDSHSLRQAVRYSLM